MMKAYTARLLQALTRNAGKPASFTRGCSAHRAAFGSAGFRWKSTAPGAGTAQDRSFQNTPYHPSSSQPGTPTREDFTKAMPEQGATGRQSSGSSEGASFDDPRQSILEASLKHLGTHGWSSEALSAGAQDLGYPGVAHGMFPNGGADLVHHVTEKANFAMSEKLQAMDLESLRVNDRVKAGVQARLEYLSQFQKTWPQAMAIGMMPNNIQTTADHLLNMVDEVWYLAGDRSTDMNWYTRRLLLLAVAIPTEIYMLTDRSPGLKDTWDFLDRRLNDVTYLARAVEQFSSLGGGVATGVSSLATAFSSMILPMIRSQQAFSPSFIPGLQQLISTLMEKVNSTPMPEGPLSGFAGQADSQPAPSRASSNAPAGQPHGSTHHSRRVYEEEVTYDAHTDEELAISHLNSAEYEDHEVATQAHATVEPTVIPNDPQANPKGAARP